MADDDASTPIDMILNRRDEEERNVNPATEPTVHFAPTNQTQYFDKTKPPSHVSHGGHAPASHNDIDMSVSSDNVFMKAFLNLKTALIIGLLFAVFQIPAVRKMFISMDGVMKGDSISAYGFFIFLTIGTLAGKLIENV